MNPLNDHELDAMLRQAKTTAPEPSPGFSDRVLRSYADQAPRAWGGFWLRPIRVPAALGLLAALLLIAAGAVVGRTLLAPTVNAQSRRADRAVVQERIVYRECNSPPHSSEPSLDGMTFNELQPVREIRPRVVRSIRDDQ